MSRAGGSGPLRTLVFMSPSVHLFVFLPLYKSFWEALSGRINIQERMVGSRGHILWLMGAVTHRTAALHCLPILKKCASGQGRGGSR